MVELRSDCHYCAFLCDFRGRVLTESRETTMLIGKSLVGHFVGLIMTPALAELHRRVFFPAYERSRGSKRAQFEEEIVQTLSFSQRPRLDFKLLSETKRFPMINALQSSALHAFLESRWRIRQ